MASVKLFRMMCEKKLNKDVTKNSVFAEFFFWLHSQIQKIKVSFIILSVKRTHQEKRR